MITTIIANEFSKQLRQQLTAEQMEEVIRLNAAERDKIGICHTHDFCDGNEIMLHALEALGIERISDALWNEAWSIAKGAGFTPAPSVAGTQPTPEEWLKAQGMFFGGERWYYANEQPIGNGLPGILAHYRDDLLRTQLDLEPLKRECDRKWENEPPQHVINIAANALHWRQVEIDKLKSGAAQGTPQVEEASRKIVEYFVKQYGDLGVALNRPDIDAVESILEHGVGAPAQPGPLPCRTPGAVYHFKLATQTESNRQILTLHVYMPHGISISEEQAEAIENRLHDACEAILAEYWPSSFAAPAQGTPEPPKVEEIAGKLYGQLAYVDIGMEEWFKKAVALLRPYFPPASQTPTRDAVKWLEDMGYGVNGKFALDSKRNWQGYEIKEILELFALGFPESGRIEPLAIPASTARTDGAEKHLRSVLMRIITDLPLKRDWLDPDLEREARALIIAAPGSVPQAETNLCIKFVTPVPNKWVVFLNGCEIQQFDFQFEAQAFGDNLKAAIFSPHGSVTEPKGETL